MDRTLDDLELEFSDDPIAGWRASSVIVSGDVAWLVGVHHQRRYKVEAHAVCTEYDHQAPTSGCHCGLHCWPSKQRAEEYRRRFSQQALCQVELFGEVICHGDETEVEGYRGAHMRTLVVEFIDVCSWCGSIADRLATRALPGFTTERLVLSSCGRCGLEPMTTGDLAQKLGTEVRFKEPSTTPNRFWQRTFFRPPIPGFPLHMAANAALGLAIFSAIAALCTLVFGAWFAAGGLALGAVAAIIPALILKTPFGSRPAGTTLATVFFIGALAVPVALSVAVNSAALRSTPAIPDLTTTEIPSSQDDLRVFLEAAGAEQIIFTPVDKNLALSFRSGTVCFQVAVDTSSPQWRAVALQRVLAPRESPCPQALPIPPPDPES